MYFVGLDVDIAGLFGFDAINFVLNVVVIFALIGMLVTIVETRLQIIGRLGKNGKCILFTCYASVQFHLLVGTSVLRSVGPSVGRSVGWSTRRFVERLVRPSVRWSVRRSVGPPLGPDVEELADPSRVCRE